MKSPEKSEKTSAGPVTPFGLSRWVLITYYTLAIGLTAYCISAIEAMKILLRSANVLPEYSAEDRETELMAITNFGWTSSLFGALIMGAATDFVGPKFTAVLGQIMFITGYALLLLVPDPHWLLLYAGALFLGVAYFAIFTSHLSVAGLFPGYTTLVLAVLGSAPDVGLSIPTILDRAANRFGMRPTMITYLSLVAVLVVADFFLVPSKPFESVTDDALEIDNSTATESVNLSSDAPNRKSGKTIGYANLSLGQQLLTVHFWILTFFTCLNLFRKLKYAHLVKPIMETTAMSSGYSLQTAENYVYAYNLTLPVAFIPALAMGWFTNYFGIAAGMCLENTWGVLLFGFCSIPFLPLQGLSITFYQLLSSYTFGICYASLATFYGLETFGTLQGIQMVFAVVISSLYPMWNKYVVNGLPSLYMSTAIVFAIGVAAYLIPLYTHLRPPCGPEKTLDETSHLLESARGNSTVDERQKRFSVAGAAGTEIARRSRAMNKDNDFRLV